MALVQERLRAKITAHTSSLGGCATAAPRYERLKERFGLLAGLKGYLTEDDLGQFTVSPHVPKAFNGHMPACL